MKIISVNHVRTHQKAFLNRTKARKRKLFCKIRGVNIVVNPGVFPPATDSKLLAANIKTGPKEKVLDVTSGAGTFGVIAGLQGAKGLAIDINPEAVKNSRQNFKRHRVNIKAARSNLLKNVPSVKFDQIFANGPFFEGKIIDDMDYAAYGFKKFINALFAEVKNYLKLKGKLLLAVSAWSDLDFLKQQAKINKLSCKLVKKKASNDKERLYYLYEIKT